MSELNVDILNNLSGFLLGKTTGKTCLIQKIIERFPEEHQAQVANILEDQKVYTAAAALKIIRQTGISEGSADSVKRHRRKECICYI